MYDPIPTTPGRSDIVDVYADTLRRLKDVLAGEDFTKASKRRAAEKIQDIQRLIKELRRENIAWCEQYIPDAYKVGMYQDEKLLKRYKGNEYSAQFSTLHKEAAMVAAEGAVADFNAIANGMEQTFVGYIRRAQYTGAKQAIAREIAGGIVEGASRQTVSNRLVEELRKKAVNGIITVGRANLNVNAYADMLARTVTRAARTEGTLNRAKEYGLDLVIISNTGAVDFCTIFEDQIFSLSGKSKRYPKLVHRPPLHPNCYSGDTEVYTENGWQLIKNVRPGTKCLSLNPNTKSVEYVTAIRHHTTVPVDKMVSFTNRAFDLLVTPNHHMLYMTEHHYKNGKRAMQFIDAEKLIGKKSGAFYRSCEWTGPDVETVTLGSKNVTLDQYIRFMAWYLSDGSTTVACNQVTLSQDRNKSADTYKEIHELLHEIGYDNHSHSSKGFSIQDKALTAQMAEYGKCTEKYIPEVIKNASREMIRLFLDTYVKADGHKKETNHFKGGNFKPEASYFTTSKRLADDLGEMIMKAGMRPSYSLKKSKGVAVKHKNGTYTGNYDVWTIRACYSQYATLQSMAIEYVDYGDLAYCVELEKYHTLWVRRNGKTCWCGNCTHTLSAFVDEFSNEDEMTLGNKYRAADNNLSTRELAKKYPVEKDDNRARTKKTQRAA